MIVNNLHMESENFLISAQQHFENYLTQFLNSLETPAIEIKDAMSYMLLDGGKRLRPVLVYASGLLFNVPIEKLNIPAVAIELIHTYSLIHDDLPAMDNDDYRRGKLSCHKKFSESTAVLTGDALLTLAFEILGDTSRNKLQPKQCLNMIQSLSRAAGYQGMIAGQMLDLDTNKKTEEQISHIQQLKTSELFCASLELGAYAHENISTEELKLLKQFGNQFGLAFQIRDDVLDQQQTNENSSMLQVVSVEKANQLVNSLFIECKTMLAPFGKNKIYLEQLCDYLRA